MFFFFKYSYLTLYQMKQGKIKDLMKLYLAKLLNLFSKYLKKYFIVKDFNITITFVIHPG